MFICHIDIKKKKKKEPYTTLILIRGGNNNKLNECSYTSVKVSRQSAFTYPSSVNK